MCSFDKLILDQEGYLFEVLGITFLFVSLGCNLNVKSQIIPRLALMVETTATLAQGTSGESQKKFILKEAAEGQREIFSGLMDGIKVLIVEQ